MGHGHSSLATQPKLLQSPIHVGRKLRLYYLPISRFRYFRRPDYIEPAWGKLGDPYIHVRYRNGYIHSRHSPANREQEQDTEVPHVRNVGAIHSIKQVKIIQTITTNHERTKSNRPA